MKDTDSSFTETRDPLIEIFEALRPVFFYLQERDPGAITLIQAYTRACIDFNESAAAFMKSVCSQDHARQRITQQAVRKNQFKLLTTIQEISANKAIQELPPGLNQILGRAISACADLIAKTTQAIREVETTFDQLQLLLQQEEQ